MFVDVTTNMKILTFLPANKIRHETLPFLPRYFISVTEQKFWQRSRRTLSVNETTNVLVRNITWKRMLVAYVHM